jgi:hypothetical protein
MLMVWMRMVLMGLGWWEVGRCPEFNVPDYRFVPG